MPTTPFIIVNQKIIIQDCTATSVTLPVDITIVISIILPDDDKIAAIILSDTRISLATAKGIVFDEKIICQFGSVAIEALAIKMGSKPSILPDDHKIAISAN